MNNLSDYTSTELLKLINDIKINHDNIKQEIVDYTFEVDNIEKIINDKIILLNELEKNYVINYLKNTLLLSLICLVSVNCDRDLSEDALALINLFSKFWASAISKV